MKLPFSNYIKAHHISHAALTAGALVAAILFFVVGAGLRLLWGPVSLGPLHGTLAGAIHDALPGIALDYDTAAVEWTRDQNRVNLVVLGARILDSHGKMVARAPKAAIDLAAAPFLHGQFVVKRITLVGVELALVHMKNGHIRLGSETDSDDDDIIRRIRDVIDARGSQSSSLQSFAVRNARLAIYDEVTGLHVTSPRASIAIRAGGQATVASFDADILMSGRKSHVTAELTMPQKRGPIPGTVRVTGLDLRGLGGAAKMFAGMKNVPLAADAAITFTVAPDGTLAAAGFDITAAGEIPLAQLKDKALHIRALTLVGAYEGKSRRLTLSSASLDAREARAVLKGTGDFVMNAAGSLERVHARLWGDNIALNMPGMFKEAVSYQRLAATADYLPASRQFDITRLTLTAPGFSLDASATVTLNDQGAPGLVSKVRIAALPIRTLLHYWPLLVAPGARDWIDANIFAGTIGPLDAETNFTPGLLDQAILPEDSLKLTFAMSGIKGSYIKGLTPATGVGGDAVMTGDTFKASFGGGRIGNLVASRGSALIPNLHQVGTVGVFSVHIDGAMNDVMTLIDMKPLNYATKFGIDPRQTGGTASADLSFKVPMLADLPVDDVAISVKADVKDFAVTLGAHTRITNGAVNFDIDNAHLHQVGVVNLADSRLNVDWTEDFRTKGPVTTRLAVKGVMTEGGRQALNIGLMRYFRGAVPVTADITGHRGGLLKADVQVDFTPALLNVPIVNLEKTPGQAASGHVVVNFAPGDIPTDETIRITGPVLNASGSATFNRDGSLNVLSFPSVKMGALNDLSFQLTRTAHSNDYVLRGHSLDGSKIGRNGTNEAPGGANATVEAQDDTPDGHFRISAKLDRLAMRDNVAIAPFNLDLAGNGSRLSGLTLNGDLTLAGKSAPIAADLETSAAGRKVTLTAGDTGMLARGLFAFQSLRGGQMTAVVNLPGQAGDIVNPAALQADFSGTLTVRNFTIINQPFLARLFSAGSLTGLGDLMGGDGMTMDELNIPFTSKNNVISINNARAVGRAIGASADGYIDRPKGMLALKGSLIPAYGVNSLISNVPLLGDLLASRKGEGIFGITYSATGNSEQPTISTNVLSMLTPGILRRIFEGHIPTKADAPSNLVAPPHGDAPANPPPPAKPQN
ncbi:MAG TPA: DUF3971 domain-containing protein [Rhizomicrobium sp.]|nr:DUF3971 domain-containing protein [Rhizomicrobium sp.]